MITPIPTPLELTGCHSRRLSSSVPGIMAFNPGLSGSPADIVYHDWYRFIIPTYSQHYDSCVGHGWANWMECMVRRYVSRSAIPNNTQINGDLVWMHARKKHWGGVMKGGIFIPQGFDAMVDLGWLPPDAILVEVPADFHNYNSALANTPVVQGHLVTPGWFEPSPEGCIAHVYQQSLTRSGHCTLGIATTVKQAFGYRALLNSWGSDWAWNGIGLMTDEYWLDTALDDVVYTVALPAGCPWSSLDNCQGWKDALISTPRS